MMMLFGTNFTKHADLLHSQWNAAVHCVMVRIVSILHMSCGRHGMASCASDIHMVNQCALWCCWALYNLCETIAIHEAQDGRVLTM